MKRKVYLIDLGTGTDRGLLPLSCGLLKAYAESNVNLSDNFDFEICMMDSSVDKLIEEIIDPFVVGIAFYCWNFLGSVDISVKLKKRFPNCIIIWGGPQVPSRQHRIQKFMDENKYVDILVHGEGELTFSDPDLKEGEYGLIVNHIVTARTYRFNINNLQELHVQKGFGRHHPELFVHK